MITEFIKSDNLLNLSFFIDEAQDLSQTQWGSINMGKTRYIYSW